MKLRGKLFSVGLAAAALATSSASAAEEADGGDWQVRLQGAYIDTKNGVDTVSVNGAPVAGAQLTTSNPVIPALTITRFLGENVAIELFCCVGSFDVDGAGALAGARVARTTAFAPALTAQYRFGPRSGVQPYVGAGAQALFFFNSRARLPGFDQAEVDTAFGPTLQAGVDVPLGNGFLLNLDAKKSFFSADARLTGGASTVVARKIELDPWILSAGVGLRF